MTGIRKILYLCILNFCQFTGYIIYTFCLHIFQKLSVSCNELVYYFDDIISLWQLNKCTKNTYSTLNQLNTPSKTKIMWISYEWFIFRNLTRKFFDWVNFDLKILRWIYCRYNVCIWLGEKNECFRYYLTKQKIVMNTVKEK